MPVSLSLTVNDKQVNAQVDPRTLLPGEDDELVAALTRAWTAATNR